MFYEDVEAWLKDAPLSRQCSVTWLGRAEKWKVTLLNTAKDAPRAMAETTSPRIAWAMMDALEAMQPRKVTVVAAKRVSGASV